ncbi:MAG: succinate dehydrogenase, cytochrome b556 subunit [Halobacteria archaeon]|nr:succinate dehydrogenase, cytochrome b556 subunit [Halobacteria archaeon]
MSLDRGRIEDFSRWRDFEPGTWAFYLHRITGLVLTLYLVMHLIVLGTAYWMGPEAFNSIIHGFESLTIVKVLELGLFAAFVFHALNGTRVVLFDMTVGLDIQEQLFYLSVAVSAAVVAVGVPFFMGWEWLL